MSQQVISHLFELVLLNYDRWCIQYSPSTSNVQIWYTQHMHDIFTHKRLEFLAGIWKETGFMH